MSAKNAYNGLKDSFCDYSRVPAFVRASKLRDSDYRTLVVREATDQEVREAIEAIDSEGSR